MLVLLIFMYEWHATSICYVNSSWVLLFTKCPKFTQNHSQVMSFSSRDILIGSVRFKQ